ncbi:MAG: hypothetical protein ACX94C_13015 [Phycisphaerales bacterium]
MGTLRVKVVGISELALYLIEAERAWDGEVDILYADAVKASESVQEEAPPDTTGP